MPEAISDSSTLIHLAGIGRLELLKEFYGKILITPTVWDEVVVEGQGRAGAGEVNGANNAGWIEGMCLAESTELLNRSSVPLCALCGCTPYRCRLCQSRCYASG
jgi:predicted nucleic acid-binding protein